MAGLFVHSLLIIEPFWSGIYFLVEMAMTSLGRWGQIFGITSFSEICSHTDVPKEVCNILYRCRDCPAELVDPNQLPDFTLGRVSKKSAILAIHQSSVSRNTSELQRHCTLFLYSYVS